MKFPLSGNVKKNKKVHVLRAAVFSHMLKCTMRVTSVRGSCSAAGPETRAQAVSFSFSPVPQVLEQKMGTY